MKGTRREKHEVLLTPTHPPDALVLMVSCREQTLSVKSNKVNILASEGYSSFIPVAVIKHQTQLVEERVYFIWHRQQPITMSRNSSKHHGGALHAGLLSCLSFKLLINFPT